MGSATENGTLATASLGSVSGCRTEIDADETRDAVRSRWRDSFAQVRPFHGDVVDPATAIEIEALAEDFLAGREALFDRRIAGSLVSHLASAINGAAVARKTSFLKDRLGQRLFRPGIQVLDDPLRRRGLRSRPFDAEGVATRRLAVVEVGVLASWILDSATARELGFASTGHAQRGVSSTPAPGPSNLHLAAGSDTPEALMADIAEGFYVTDLIGVGVNQVTGDYSRGASGFWIENGKRSYPVSEVTIAGNLIEMFQTLLPANDLEFRFGTNAPSVRVEGLTVAGR